MDNSFIEYLKECVDVRNKNDILQYLNKEISAFLSQLDNIWDEIGIDVYERAQRGFSVIGHIKTLLIDMLKEAEDKKKYLATTIESLLKDLSELGTDLEINMFDDITGYEYMPLLTVKKHLEDKIKMYQNIRALRLKEIKELQNEEEHLCKILGKRPKHLLSSPFPSRNMISEFKNYLHKLNKEKKKREEIFCKTKNQINIIMTELEISANSEFEKKMLNENKSTFLLTDENMKQLEDFHIKIECYHKEIVADIADLREKVNLLWDRLQEDQENRNLFFKQHSRNSMNTYNALKQEEIKCKEKIQVNIKIFIDKIRKDIVKWWQLCWYCDEQKKEFCHFDSECYTEDLLTLHETYIDKLKQQFEKNKNIYGLISKRDKLWRRLLELEEKAINPNRYKNRGGQLLLEEKERKSIRTQLSKVEQQLGKLVEKYTQENQKTFLILGKRVTDIIENDWEQLKENRHLKVSAKKHAMVNSEISQIILQKASLHLKSKRTALPSPSAKQKLEFRSPSTKKNKKIMKIPKLQVNELTIENWIGDS